MDILKQKTKKQFDIYSMENEQWKAYPANENYHVSNLGRIKGPLGQIMKPQKSGIGYFAVKVYKKSTLIHRMVAETWLPNPNRLKAVGFKDMNKSNCHVDNLYWTESRLKYGKVAWEAILLINIESRQEIHVVNYNKASKFTNSAPITLGKIIRGEIKKSKVMDEWHVLTSPIPRMYFVDNGLDVIYGPEAEQIIKQNKL